MRIIYFTTSINEKDYAEFIKKWTIALNPSNQNFHNKMIRSLAISEKVDVISIRPFSRSKCEIKKLLPEEKTEGNISWHYLGISRNKLLRNHSIKKQIDRLFKKDDLSDSIILSDTINPRIIRLANGLKNKKSAKIVGICTDSPSNISGTGKSYSLYVLSQSKALDGYIGLTDSLCDLFNQEDKPSMVVEGIVEDNLPVATSNKYGKYFFFGGALLPRYGVYDLIKAFNKIEDKDIKLLICGHHGDTRKLKEAIHGNKNIKVMGLLPVKEVLSLEQNAVLNINPRPFSEDLDRYSIPSKTLEYLSTGTLTLSVRNTKLQKHFQDEVIWVRNGDEDDLLEGLNKAISMSEAEKDKMSKSALKKVKELYSLTSINKLVIDFLKKL